jgi:antitoxin MazE
MITKIGNSQSIRIPKPLIQQVHLENANLELEVLENGLLIKPIDNIQRENWKKRWFSIVRSNQSSK